MIPTNPPAVLIVDDNEAAAKFIKLRLTESGLHADYATSVESIIPFLDTKYTVIVADYHLGKSMTGVDLIRMYKAKYPHVRTILYTRGEEDEEMNHALEEFDFDKVLFSQEDFDVLLDCIKRYCVTGIEPQIIEAIFSEIDRIKNRMAWMQKYVATIDCLKTTVDKINDKVGLFIDKHQNDAYKIIGVVIFFEVVRIIIEKLWQ
jgi:DNA-binding NtrC family response regulator